MKAYWNDLSARERQLIMIAGGLLVVLFLVLVIVRPAMALRTDARAAFEDAVETYVVVGRAAARPGNASTADASAVRSILTSTAAQSGIIINRINSEADVIDLSVADVDAARLFAWLGFLESQHQIVVRVASVRPGASSGLVAARLGVAKEGT